MHGRFHWALEERAETVAREVVLVPALVVGILRRIAFSRVKLQPACGDDANEECRGQRDGDPLPGASQVDEWEDGQPDGDQQ